MNFFEITFGLEFKFGLEVFDLKVKFGLKEEFGLEIKTSQS